MRKVRFGILCGIQLFLSSFFSNAQNSFQLTIGGPVSDVSSHAFQTMDGGYLINGATSSYGTTQSSSYLVKLNLSGDTVWTRAISENCASCTSSGNAYDAMQLTDSSYVILGGRHSSSINHALLARLSPNGDTTWIRTYAYHDIVYGMAMVQSADAGFILGCTTADTGSNPMEADLAIIKTDSAGIVLWSRRYSENYGQSLSDVLITRDSGLLLAGSRKGPFSAPVLFYLVKTNLQGDTLWAKEYSRIGNYKSDYLSKVIETSNGGYLLVGTMDSPAFDPDEILVTKTDSLGNLTWSYSYGSLAGPGGKDVMELSDGSYLICGNFDTSAMLLKIDSSGNVLWVRSYATGNFNSVREASDGGVILSGTIRQPGQPYWDIYLVKTDVALTSGCNEQFEILFYVDHTPNTIVTSISPQIDTTAATIMNSPTFISSGGLINLMCYTGVEDMNSARNTVVISPNPTSNNFNIACSFVIKKAIVFDALGQKVIERMIQSKEANFDLSRFAAGIYFVQVYLENDAVLSQRLLLNR